jgi:hypothetical protein
MKTIQLLPLVFLASLLHADPIAPATDKDPVARVSAIAAKFADVYSQSPQKMDEFVVGSAVSAGLLSDGIERVTLVCVDGFTKTYDFGNMKESATKTIDYRTPTAATINYGDGSSVEAEFFQCSARPIAFIIYTKKMRQSDRPASP